MRFAKNRFMAFSATKIVYAGIRNENYDPNRSGSFEYGNFYGTLKQMGGVEVIEYPFDSIVGLGKRRWNEGLLSLIKKEKPDLFFAFMFSDEFDIPTLQQIKQLTTSVAWFADDHRRTHNYSRFWAPRFSWAATTWSRGPEVYARYGVRNVFRSQWACRKPFKSQKNLAQDIDVSFIGQRTAARARLIRGLRDSGIRVYVRGFGWPEGRATAEEAGGIINRSKINLNINDTEPLWSPWSLGQLLLRRSRNRFVPDFHLMSNWRFWQAIPIPQIKARPFELAGRGAFVVSGYADDFEKYYKENEEMVFYRSTEDLIKKIKYYLAHEEERERIARAGYERTLREHTYENRFRELFYRIGLRL